jgi:hypothetical protein
MIPCTWDVARLSESVKIHSPTARVFHAFRKSRNIRRAWITQSCTENIRYSFINFKFLCIYFLILGTFLDGDTTGIENIYEVYLLNNFIYSG